MALKLNLNCILYVYIYIYNSISYKQDLNRSPPEVEADKICLILYICSLHFCCPIFLRLRSAALYKLF